MILHQQFYINHFMYTVHFPKASREGHTLENKS